MLIKFQIVSIILLALSSNLDNIGIGISYGIRKINISFNSNLLIAFITTSGTYLSITAGNIITKFLRPDIANAIGALILAGAGILVFIQKLNLNEAEEKIYQSQQIHSVNFSKLSFLSKLLTTLNHPFLDHADFKEHITIKEGFRLGMALTLNNLANGIGSGILRLNIVFVTISNAIISIITIWIGINLGQYSGVHWFGKHSTRISGVMLVAIAIFVYAN